MTDTAPSPFPQVRWKFERTPDGFQLLAWLPPDPASPVRIPMNEHEAFLFLRGADRVTSWAAQESEGAFTTGPAPDQAALQLAVGRYIVTSPDMETHTRMVKSTPWANWVEQVPRRWPDTGMAWLVDVFEVDDPQFLQTALAHGVTVTREPADGG